MTPSWIRMFAQTDGSGIGMAALEYTKSLLRIAPVRELSVNGGLSGPWSGYGRLLTTPMDGPFVSGVCCDSARWTWLQAVPMPSQDLSPSALAASATGADLELPAPSTDPEETAKGRCELYTAGVRNILFAVGGPRGKDQATTALRYEGIVVPNEHHRAWWAEHKQRVTAIIGTPVSNGGHDQLRGMVCP